MGFLREGAGGDNTQGRELKGEQHTAGVPHNYNTLPPKSTLMEHMFCGGWNVWRGVGGGKQLINEARSTMGVPHYLSSACEE